MTYTGGKIPVGNHEIVNYEDKYYNECQKVLRESFRDFICLRELESELNAKGYRKKIVASQGWNIIESEYEKYVIDFLVKKEWKEYL